MRDRLLPVWLALGLFFGCGGNEFHGDGDDASSGSGGSGAVGGMTGGSSGTAGMPAGGTGAVGGSGTGCSCAPTEYCRSGDCLPCAELSTLDFGDPLLVLDDPERSLRFPRAADTPSSLFYRAGNEGAGELHHTPNASALGPVIGDPNVNQNSGPLYVAALGRSYNVVFDQTSQGMRTARAATWNGTTLSASMEMPPPLSPGGFDDYSVAAATSTSRLFWMSTRDDNVLIRTGQLGGGDGEVVNVRVPKRTGTGDCPLSGTDATPWVTPDGRRMFFRSLPPDDACQPLDAMTTDLYVVPLEPQSGVPTQTALALSNLNEVGVTDTDPSLTPDFCALYFASDRNSPGNSDFKLYRANRR
jgi:hypothetical protein